MPFKESERCCESPEISEKDGFYTCLNCGAVYGGISGDIFQERYEKVIEYYDAAERALEIDLNNKTAWFNRGVILIHLEKYDSAITSFEKVLDIDPEDTDAWEAKGYALNKLEYYEKAIECYKKVNIIDPKKDGYFYLDIKSIEYDLYLKAKDDEMYDNRYEEYPEYANEVLDELEATVGRIPIDFEIRDDTFGVIIDENDNVLELGLYDRDLETLPESIGDLDALETLQVERNELTSLPKSIGNLSSLKILWLGGNHLTTLPESIGNLKSLIELDLVRNQLTTLPESIGNLSSLQILILDDNQLTTLPVSIGDLKSLRMLRLKGNQLITLPETIGNLKSLRYLVLECNQLTTLPESIGNLSSLTLVIKNNPLKTFPASIERLESLEEIILSSDQLTLLPESLKDRKKIEDEEKCYEGLWIDKERDYKSPEIVEKCCSSPEIVEECGYFVCINCNAVYGRANGSKKAPRTSFTGKSVKDSPRINRKP